MTEIMTDAEYRQYMEDVDPDCELIIGKKSRTADDLRAEITEVVGFIRAQLENVGADALDTHEDFENAWLIGWLLDVGECSRGLAQSIRNYQDNKSASR